MQRPDCHLIEGVGVAFFPESGKLYGVPAEATVPLRAWLDGTGPLPPEAEAMTRAEAARTPAPLPVSQSPTDSTEVTSLCLYAAHDCNLACSYCYNQRGRAAAPFAMMSPETAKAAIDRFFRKPGVSYAAALYGGEPFLNVGLIRPLTEHVERLRQDRDIRISLSATTNGTVMNRELLGLLDRHFSSITVSLDGAGPINDRHRRYEKADTSAHDKAVATIRLLKEQTGLRVTVKGTLTAQGLPHYRESLAYLTSLGADAAALDPAFGPTDADWALTDEDFAGYAALQAADAAADLADPENDTRPWQEFTFQIVAGLLTRRRLLRHCNAGRDLAVMADGTIHACHGLAGQLAFRMGRVDEPDSPEFARLRSEFSSLDVRGIEGCATCWARYLCGGGCYANAWFNAGSVRRCDTRRCTLFKTVAERAIGAFVAAMADPVRSQALLRRMRRAIGTAPKTHV